MRRFLISALLCFAGLAAADGTSGHYQVDQHARRALESHGYVIAHASRAAFIVVPSVTKVETAGRSVSCAVSIHVAPLDAQGREKWEAGAMSIASGTATLSRGAPTDCVAEAVTETIKARVVPFLARVRSTETARATSRLALRR